MGGAAVPQLMLVLSVMLVAPATAALARDRHAATAAEIGAALAGAQPGDVITIEPGHYDLSRTVLRESGRPGQPVTVRARRPGDVEIRSHDSELFKIRGSDWTFENLDLVGACGSDAACEHAFHIVAGADRTVIRDNRLRDFNAQIKGNGEGGRFPRDVVIEGNTLFATHHRVGEQPLALVDVVGGRHWVVRNNLFADFGKVIDHSPRRPDDYGYAVFLKGNSTDGVIADNFIACSVFLPPAPFTRALSLGGSGTGPGLCQIDCGREHADGLVRGNVVLNCPTGAGIYLYKASASRLVGNTLLGTEGILASALPTTARLDGNVVSGAIAATDGAQITAGDDLLVATPPRLPDPSTDDTDVCAGLPAAATPGRIAACRAMAAALAGYRRYVAALHRQAPAAPLVGR